MLPTPTYVVFVAPLVAFYGRILHSLRALVMHVAARQLANALASQATALRVGLHLYLRLRSSCGFPLQRESSLTGQACLGRCNAKQALWYGWHPCLSLVSPDQGCPWPSLTAVCRVAYMLVEVPVCMFQRA